MSVESSLFYTWEHEDGTEVKLELSFTMSTYDPGVCSGPPDLCYPPEGGEIEVTGCDPDLPEFWMRYNGDSNFQRDIDDKCTEKGVELQDEPGRHFWNEDL